MTTADDSTSHDTAVASTAPRWMMLRAALPVAGLAVALPVATWLVDGRSQAERAATQLLMPLGLLWLALLLAACWAIAAGQRRWGGVLVLLWLMLTFGGNGMLADAAIQQIEWPPTQRPATAEEPLRTVIVLGGGAGLDPAKRPELKDDGQRVFAAAQLWHARQTQSIICTGISSRRKLTGPAEIGRRLLQSVGVPEQAIFEVGGPNTFGEMRALAALLEDPPAGFPQSGRIGLITSAFHMPRAMRLAEQARLPVVPIPCSYRSAPEDTPFSPIDLIPSAQAASTVAIVVKERLAGLLGR